MKTVIIALDSELEREALKVLLHQEYEHLKISEASGLQELMALPYQELTADVVVTDMVLNDQTEVFTQFQAFKEKFPAVKILAIDNFKNLGSIKYAFKSGLDGYLLKFEELDELNYALDQILAGKQVLSNKLAIQLLYQAAETERTFKPVTTLLTQREMEVLALIAEGFKNYEIATKLFTSRRTVEGHRFNIIKKLQVKNSPELVKCAYNLGLIGTQAS